MSKKLFMLALKIQKPEIEKCCFGVCQKINFGTIIVVDHLGELLNCNEVTCPFVDKETPDPSAVIDGNDLYLRRLKQ